MADAGGPRSVIGGRYEVEAELGAGGFGTTHRARDRVTGDRVAVKVLDLRRVDDWKAVELFEREARVLQTLDHPGIPKYVEFRPLEAEREAYLVQGLAPGENLEVVLGKRRFTEPELVDLTGRVLDILAYLGSLHPPVIHRDLKPANILLADDRAVSVVDFGAVRDIARPDGGSTVAGTFGYMAPEQLQGEAAPSSDLYALGMTLVHVASGTEPSEFPKQRLKPDFRPHVHLSKGLEDFIDRLIEPVPDDRFQSAVEALEALRALDLPDPALSSEAIARRRAALKPVQSKPVAKPRPVAEPSSGRVSIEEDDQGFTIVVRPAPYWRGREAHFGILAVLGPLLAFAIGMPLAGMTGMGLGFVAVLALGYAFWHTAPTWRLRVTDRGDFLLYTRNPNRPKWVGARGELAIETTPTARGDALGYLKLVRGEEPSAIVLYPLGPGDASRLEDAARRLKG